MCAGHIRYLRNGFTVPIIIYKREVFISFMCRSFTVAVIACQGILYYRWLEELNVAL